MQLVGRCSEGGGCIDMLDTMKNQRIDVPEVVEKFGVPPELVGDVLALMGDSVDNVPGIYGIGPKTATKLIQEHGSLAAVLDAAAGNEAVQAAGALGRRARDGRAQPRARPAQGRLRTSLCARRHEARRGAPRSARRVPVGTRLHQPAQAAGRRPGQPRTDEPAQSRQAADHWCRGERGRQPPAPARDARLSTVRPTSASPRSTGSNTGSRAPSHRGSWRSTPRPAASTRCAPNSPGSALRWVPTMHAISRSATAAATCSPKSPSRWTGRRHMTRCARCSRATRSSRSGRTSSTTSTSSSRCAEINVAPIDDTMIVSFALDAGRSLDGIGGGHGMDELSTRHLGHTTLTFKDICGAGKKAIPFGEVPLDRATRICRRGCRRNLAAVEDAAPPPRRRRRNAGLRTGRPAADPGRRADGAPRDQGRSPATRPAERGIRARDRAYRTRNLRLLRHRVHHRQPQATGRRAVRQARLQGRAQGQERAVFDRPGDPRRTRQRRAPRWPRWCSSGASCRSSRTPTPMRCRPRSTPTPGGSTPATASSARRPGGCRRPIPTSRTSRSAPRSGARSARPSSPKRATCCSRRTTARSNCASPRTWPTCRS